MINDVREDPDYLRAELIDAIKYFLSIPKDQRGKQLRFMQDGRRDHYNTRREADLAMLFWYTLNQTDSRN